MKKIVKRRGHRHVWDIVDRYPVDAIKTFPPIGIIPERTVVERRTIRIRICACGEPGYEVPA